MLYLDRWWKKKKKDLVSVIMSNYNYSNFLTSSINSVLNQTYKNIELIIIDDASTDDSVDTINSIKDKRIKLIKNKKNKGVSESRNIGVKEAKGEFIAFIDSDDIWSKNKLEDQINLMKNNNYAFTYTDFFYVKDSIIKKHVLVPNEITYKENLWNTIILTSTVVFNMNIISKKDLYFEDILIGEDVLCFWNVLKKYGNAYGINGDYVYKTKHKNSLSANYINNIKGVIKLYGSLDLPLYKKIILYLKHYIKAILKRYKFSFNHIILVVLIMIGLFIPKVVTYKTSVQIDLENKINNVLNDNYEIKAYGFYNSIDNEERNSVEFKIDKINGEYILKKYSCTKCFIDENDVINYFKELEPQFKNVKQVSLDERYHLYYSSIFTDKLFKVLRKINNASSEAYIEVYDNRMNMNIKYYLLTFNITITNIGDTYE